MASLESLPPELLDRVLRSTGLSAAQAARLLPRVCRAWRASASRVAASCAPFATQLALACGEARAVLLLRIRLLPSAETEPVVAPPAVTLAADDVLARYDVPSLDEPGGDEGTLAWTTYIARCGARGGDAATLMVCEYARAGLMLLRAELAPGGVTRLECTGSIVHPQLAVPEGLACGPDGRVYVASVGEYGRQSGVVLLQPPEALEGGPAPTHDVLGERLPGAAEPRVLQHHDMPDILDTAVLATPWDIALGRATDPNALFVAVHTDVSNEDGQYWKRTDFATGGIWRVPLQRGRFTGRASWAVPPLELNRPSAVAFSRCGRIAYVATFVTVPDAEAPPGEPLDEGGARDPRGVVAFDVPLHGRAGRTWTRRPGWDALACARAGVFPWALAVDGGSGAIIATAHGGAAGHCVAQLCAATGAVRATWRHAALDDSAPNALALL